LSPRRNNIVAQVCLSVRKPIQGTPIEQIDSDGTPLYFQHDQLDSTRLLTDKDGVVAASFSYDAYGTLTRKEGEADTRALLGWALSRTMRTVCLSALSPCP
jgi:hypothetical protein